MGIEKIFQIFTTKKQIIYGDESLGYKTPARDMTPQEAKNYLDSNEKDCILMQMNQDRRSALLKRAGEKQ